MNYDKDSSDSDAFEPPHVPHIEFRDSSSLFVYSDILSNESKTRIQRNLDMYSSSSPRSLDSDVSYKKKKRRGLKAVLAKETNKVEAREWTKEDSISDKPMTEKPNHETVEDVSLSNIGYKPPKTKLPPLGVPTTALVASSAVGMNAAVPDAHGNNNIPAPPTRLPPLEQEQGSANPSYEVEADEQTNEMRKKTKEESDNTADNKYQFYKRPKATLFFKDGVRRIDFVLAYQDSDTDRSKNKDIRERFEAGLVQAGLELEWEPKEESQDENTYFVKIHCPWETLTKYAERMSMKMPLKVDPDMLKDKEEKTTNVAKDCFHGIQKFYYMLQRPFRLKELEGKEDDSHFYTHVFSRSKMSFFNITDKDTFFSNADRSRIAYRILSETRYGAEGDKLELGIAKLQSQGVYDSYFPLHEGKHASTENKLPINHNARRFLYWQWARWGRWYKYQPLQEIRLYFGEKIGMYFAFLGFYSMMLLNASIMGLIIVIYGLITLFADANIRRYLGDKVALYFAWLGFYTHMLLIPSVVGLIVFLFSVFSLNNYYAVNEVCDEAYPTYAGNVTMCPLCDQECTYWKLKSSCLAARITYLFDNEATIFFAAFMSLWATMFFEFWKRRQFRLAYEWDLVDYDEDRDLIRPEFEAQVTNMRFNPITQRKEPYLKNKERYARAMFSYINVLFWILVIFAAVLAIIVYRLAITAVLASNIDFSQYQDVSVVGQFVTPQMLTTITASTLSLIIIMSLNKVYEKFAVWLTERELPRTQLQFEDSFTFKMFCFQFVNYYSYLFYIAFFKQSFAGYPGEYTYFAGRWRWEQCDSGGCMYELSIQLFIIMFGKQLWNNVVELMLPWIKNKLRRWRRKEKPDNEYTRWEQDYDLLEVDQFSLFYEYLEMVIQFGFVTLFVAAFPLAPLLALLNNVIEIRLDANKFICELRRPLAQKCADIGVWYNLLEFIGALSVVTNSFTIALTSDAIPKMVYYHVYSLDEYGGNYTANTHQGFTENSLSYFNTSDFASRSIPKNTDPFGEGNVTMCRYRDYRTPPWETPKYRLTMQYWHIVAARLAFVIVMESTFLCQSMDAIVTTIRWYLMTQLSTASVSQTEHVVFLLKALLDYLIPDRSQKLNMEIKREHYLVKDMLAKAETEHLVKQAVEEQKIELSQKNRKPQTVMSTSFVENPDGNMNA